ncbi:hypothetical protein F5Y14DRAFT_31579 [Nemania sp. NC0429]|nr:hypothetical protein F5Y14DRAFT_31579 [Nemania sp. NC0429]
MASGTTTFEQFVRYVNDLAGLERIFRLLQSIVQIGIAYPSTIHLVDPLILLIIPVQSSVTTLNRAVLLVLQQRIDLARRYLRVFRFLDTFQQAQRLFHQHVVTSPPPPGTSLTKAPNPTPASEESSGTPYTPSSQRRARTEEWLDLLGRSFNGMYLLVETSTIVDYMQVDGLHVWGAEGKIVVNAEAQRFWLFTLVCGVLAGIVRISRLLAAEDETPRESTNMTTGDDDAGEPTEKGSSGRPRGKEEEEEERQRHKSKTLKRLVRGVVTNAIDIVLPAVVIGWLHVGPGVVALAMFATTLSTSVDIWKRCGREITGRK